MASRLIHVPSGQVLAERLECPRSLLERMRGLLGRNGLPPGEGMMIERCASIHTFFMKFKLDVIFLGEDLTVRRQFHDLKPWRLASALGARHVVELPSGTLDRVPVALGDGLRIEDAQ